MNILLTNATDIFAGGEDYVLILARHLTLRGHSVWVSARPDHLLLRKCAASLIPTVPVGYGDMRRVFTVSRELRGRMKERGIDVIHSNANYDRTCAALAAAFTPVKHVAGIHSTHSIQHNITHWLRNRYGTDHFIVDADAGKEVLVTQDRIPSAMITTVPIGIENDPAETRGTFRASTRAALGISPDTIVIGNVARLVNFKGQSFLLEAVAETAQTRADILLLIVGDGELEMDLRRRAETLGITPIVRFLGFRDDLEKLYPAFDVYCHSSLELAAEMFPIAILRALASALPVVCTNAGGIAAMVDEGKSGHVIPPGDSHALARGLLDVIATREKRASMGESSFDLFRRKYHASAMAEKVERIYRHAVGTLLLVLLLVSSSCTSRRAFQAPSPADSLAIMEDNMTHRVEADAFFRKDPQSPFARDTSIVYHGLRWFPVNPAFVGKSVLHTYEVPETVIVMGTRGEERRQLRYGYFEFDVPGEDGFPVTLRLNVYKFTPSDRSRYDRYPEYLNVWFTDLTTGAETYDIGRYVDVGDDVHDPQHMYTVDLNKAYNPYCAYSNQFSCAIPRKEDRVGLSLRVGELKYHQ